MMGRLVARGFHRCDDEPTLGWVFAGDLVPGVLGGLGLDIDIMNVGPIVREVAVPLPLFDELPHFCVVDPDLEFCHGAF